MVWMKCKRRYQNHTVPHTPHIHAQRKPYRTYTLAQTTMWRLCLIETPQSWVLTQLSVRLQVTFDYVTSYEINSRCEQRMMSRDFWREKQISCFLWILCCFENWIKREKKTQCSGFLDWDFHWSDIVILKRKIKTKKNIFLCILVITAKTKAFYAISTCVTYWDFGDHFGFLHIDVIFYLWWTSIHCFVIVYSIKVLFF